MKTFASFCFIFWFALNAGAQFLIKGEYFFNSDPGFGQGLVLEIQSPDSVAVLDLNLNLATAGLSEGFHTVFFRFQDENGKWSFNYPRIFLKTSVENTDFPIHHLEYFIDFDPGEGSGMAVAILDTSTSVTIDFNANISGFSEGFHRFYLRARNQDGRWSMLQSRVFYLKKKENSSLSNISEIRYFFTNQNYHSDTLTFPVDPPMPSVALDFQADLSVLPPDQAYDMFIFAVNEDGQQSMLEKRTIHACSDSPPIAGFGYIGFGSTFSFIDSSSNAKEYFWDFGDGHTDTVSNPIHRYTAFGDYTVRQVVRTACTTDTFTLQIHVTGLTDISNRVGGNYGSVSVTVYGGGFNTNSQFFLFKPGVVIEPDTLVLLEEGAAWLRFDLRGRPTGVYDMRLVQGVVQDALTGIFTIVEKTDSPRFSVHITSRPTIRANRPESVTITVSNLSPVDAVALPLYIVIKGDTTVGIQFDFEWLEPGSVDSVDYSAIRPYMIVNMPEPAVVIPLMVPYLLANTSESLTVTLTAHADLVMETWVGRPFYNSPLPDNLAGCLEGLLSVATQLTTPDNPVSQCLTGVMENSFSIYLTSYSEANGIADQVKKYGNVLFSFAKMAAKCSELAGWVLPGSVNIKLALKMQEILLNIRAASFFEDFYNLRVNCVDFFFGTDDTWVSSPIQVVNSYDPNEKTGPLNATGEHFLRGDQTLRYAVFFENVDTATAAAQAVFVTDTLDSAVLDLSTFALGEMGFGNKNQVLPPSGLSAYSALVDLRPEVDLVVRVDAKLDPADGIVRWRFLSLDPQNLELTVDPLLGFLPPNVHPGEGEGFVSFTIRPKAGLLTGTTVQNRASILFDLNPPILTNYHLNTLDNDRPSSAVQGLANLQNDSVFVVDWSGTDVGSGIRAYDVYVSIGTDTFQRWQFDTELTQGMFHGQNGVSYGFFSIAKDWAGNTEILKTTAEASTLVLATPELKADMASIRIYPNPCNGLFQVTAHPLLGRVFDLTLTDVTGRNLKTLKASENGVWVNGSDLPKGLYFLSIVFENHVFTRTVSLN